MQQISNGFCDKYYLTEDGRVYNAETKGYTEADKGHRFTLRTKEGERKKVALKTLYNMVYNKPYCKDNIKGIEGEEWKEVDNTKGMYYVSNKGRIKSYKGYEAKLLKQTKTKNGYYRLDIVQDNIRVSKLVHRLVAASFLPVPKDIDMELHHKDYNKENNKSDNLEWLTMVEHRKKHQERKVDNANNNSTKTESSNS